MKKGFRNGLFNSLDCTLSGTFKNLSFEEGLINKKSTYSSLNRCSLENI